jgi:hypothetical protein
MNEGLWSAAAVAVVVVVAGVAAAAVVVAAVAVPAGIPRFLPYVCRDRVARSRIMVAQMLASVANMHRDLLQIWQT